MALQAVAVLLFIAAARQAVASSVPDADALADRMQALLDMPHGKAFT